MYIVESEEECQNPWCPDREEIAEPHDHHDHDEPSDPSLCDCDDPSRRDMHTRILGHIAQLEKLYRELVVAHKVTITLHAQAKPMRSVDPSVPPDGSRGQLEALGRMMMELELDGDKYDTPCHTFFSKLINAGSKRKPAARYAWSGVRVPITATTGK